MIDMICFAHLPTRKSGLCINTLKANEYERPLPLFPNLLRLIQRAKFGPKIAHLSMGQTPFKPDEFC